MDFAYTIAQVDAMENGTEKAIQWLVYALLWNGDHHKQWFIEKTLAALGTDMADIRQWLTDKDWTQPEPGIAP